MPSRVPVAAPDDDALSLDVRDMDLALCMIPTASGAVLHRAAVERPEDLSTGVIADELVTLLCRYLRKPDEIETPAPGILGVMSEAATAARPVGIVAKTSRRVAVALTMSIGVGLC